LFSLEPCRLGVRMLVDIGVYLALASDQANQAISL